MNKLGYDETNISTAITDLGRCEIEIRYLQNTIKELNQEIFEKNNKIVRLENEVYSCRNRLGYVEQQNSIERKLTDRKLNAKQINDLYDQLDELDNTYSKSVASIKYSASAKNNIDDIDKNRGESDRKRVNNSHEKDITKGEIARKISNINMSYKTGGKKYTKHIKKHIKRRKTKHNKIYFKSSI
jgi:hypothetical protein